MTVQVPEEILEGAQKVGAIAALIDMGFSKEEIKYAAVSSGVSPLETALILSKLGAIGFGASTKGGIGKSLVEPATTKMKEPAAAERPMKDTSFGFKEPPGATPVEKTINDPTGSKNSNPYMKNMLGLGLA